MAGEGPQKLHGVSVPEAHNPLGKEQHVRKPLSFLATGVHQMSVGVTKGPRAESGLGAGVGSVSLFSGISS